MSDWSPEAHEGKCEGRDIKCVCRGSRSLIMHAMCSCGSRFKEETEANSHWLTVLCFPKILQNFCPLKTISLRLISQYYQE